MTEPVDRRAFLMSIPALMLAPNAFAQYAAGRIRLTGFNHVSLNVSDLKRSTEFYQGLFGMPVQSRQGATSVQLRIGAGPQFLNLSGAGAAPGIDHMCAGVDQFDVTRILKVLADHGVGKSDQRGPMKVQVTRRGPDEGGAPQGTPEVHVGDPDGIDMQLQDKSYCGGGGTLGNVCSAVTPAPGKGLIPLKGYSHCTVFASDAARSNKFYQDLFGMPFRSYQGPASPTLAIGPTVEFLMFTGGGPGRGGASAPPRAASINHFCMSLEKFESDQILKTLESFGIKPRESQTGAAGPMRHYISMRMENRGGAKEGTPELYFTDPDGILVQLQDVTYCGGGGALGNVCPPASPPAAQRF